MRAWILMVGAGLAIYLPTAMGQGRPATDCSRDEVATWAKKYPYTKSSGSLSQYADMMDPIVVQGGIEHIKKLNQDNKDLNEAYRRQNIQIKSKLSSGAQIQALREGLPAWIRWIETGNMASNSRDVPGTCLTTVSCTKNLVDAVFESNFHCAWNVVSAVIHDLSKCSEKNFSLKSALLMKFRSVQDPEKIRVIKLMKRNMGSCFSAAKKVWADFPAEKLGVSLSVFFDEVLSDVQQSAVNSPPQRR